MRGLAPAFFSYENLILQSEARTSQRRALYNQSIAKYNFCNSFLLIFIRNGGGGGLIPSSGCSSQQRTEHPVGRQSRHCLNVGSQRPVLRNPSRLPPHSVRRFLRQRACLQSRQQVDSLAGAQQL